MIPESLLHISTIESMLGLAGSTPHGCFVEVGVYRGGSAWYLAKLAKQQDRTLHLFDTFTGIPEQGIQDKQHKVGDFGDTTLTAVKEAIPDAIYHVGIFPGTLPKDGLGPVAFAHIDADQYKSIKACIEHLWPMMVPGSVMLFDDYNATSGCKQAVTEAFGPAPLCTDQGKAYIVKV
jgi:O-methyltransferase